MTMPPAPQQPAPPYQPPAAQQPPHQPAPAAKGLAIAALVVGIVAFLTGLVPVGGALVGIAAIILGAIALSKKQPKGLALTGLILGAVAVIASIGMTIGLGAVGNEVTKSLEELESTTTTETSPATEEPAEEEAAPEPTERLTLDDGWTSQGDEYGITTTVTGYVSNNSDKPISNYVQITFDTLDAAGANIGTCLANTNTIDANGKWKFEAICLDGADEINEIRFKEITGF